MYCVKCGVELSDSERKCPLCNTPVYYPDAPTDAERPYPEFVESREEFNPKAIYFVVSFLYAIAAIISALCDLNMNSSITWSGYVVGGILLSYVILVLPNWWRRPSPAIFVPVDFVAIGLLLLYISLATDGGWFLSFAFPILGAFGTIICAICILTYYIKRGHLYIYGGAAIALSILCPFIEILIHLNFEVLHDGFAWSIYPFCALFLIGIMLIIIAIVPPFRESLRKIFAL